MKCQRSRSFSVLGFNVLVASFGVRMVSVASFGVGMVFVASFASE